MVGHPLTGYGRASGGPLDPSPTLTLAAVQAMAPDQAALSAAGGLLRPAKWPVLAGSAERRLVWGECQGSGSTPYRVCLTLDDLGYTCSCPSRKFPCKHTLALLWFMADRPAQIAAGAPPDWVEDWFARRKKRPGAAPPPSARPALGVVKDIAVAAAPPATDPAEDARKAAAAEKRRKEREASVSGGLEDLERWVGDVLGEGLATFATRASDRCRRIASRLVDAKAGTLATRVDELAATVFALRETEREAWLLGELGRLVLLAHAWRRRDALPSLLVEDLRRMIGWSPTREQVLADPEARRVADVWSVLHVRQVTQVDNLLRRETWLRRHGVGAPRGEAPDFALLLDFFPVAAAGEATFAAGEVVRATLAYYPSAVPLRAQIDVRDAATLDAPPEAAFDAESPPGVDGAVREAHALWAVHPWLDPTPVLVGDAELGRLAGRWVVSTPDGAFLPVTNEVEPGLIALAGVGPSRLAMLLEPAGARLLGGSTRFGFWGAP